jgi:hypothetical protein
MEGQGRCVKHPSFHPWAVEWSERTGRKDYASEAFVRFIEAKARSLRRGRGSRAKPPRTPSPSWAALSLPEGDR